MATWRVNGVDRETAVDRSVVVDAPDLSAAQAKALELGVFVEAIRVEPATCEACQASIESVEAAHAWHGMTVCAACHHGAFHRADKPRPRNGFFYDLGKRIKPRSFKIACIAIIVVIAPVAILTSGICCKPKPEQAAAPTAEESALKESKDFAPKLAAMLEKIAGGGSFSVVDADVRKTDSVSHPFESVVSCRWDKSGVAYEFEFTLRKINGKWSYISGRTKLLPDDPWLKMEDTERWAIQTVGIAD